MIRSRDWIKARVAVRVDEFNVIADNVGGATSLEDPIRTIDDELNQAAIHVVRNAREDFLYPILQSDKKRYHGDNVQDVDVRLEINSDLIGLVVCPQDFLRFISLKLSSWSREVRDLIDPRSPEYRVQQNSIGGSIYKPTAVLSPFGEYILKVTGTITGTFTVGETVTGSGGPSGSNAFTAKVKEKATGYIIFENVSGVIGTTRAHSTITGDSSGATITTYTDIQDEFSKYKRIKTIPSDVTISTALVDAQVVDTLTLATNDIVSPSGQTDSDENGTYLVNASGAPTKLSHDINTPNMGTSLEVYRCESTNDTIDKFHYIPRLLPEEMPEELLDAVIDQCAGRVLKYLGRMEPARAAFESAAYLMGAQQQGIKE